MKKLIATSVLAAITSLSAVADEPSFNFVEGGYSDYEFDDSLDADGLLLRGNAELSKDFFVAASFESLSSSINVLGQNIDIDAEQLLLGLGYKMPISNSTTAYTTLSYMDVTLDSNVSDSASEDGYQVGLGIRSQLSKETQAYGEVTHNALDDSTSTGLSVGLRQSFTDNLGAYVEAKMDDFEGSGFGVGLSYNF